MTRPMTFVRTTFLATLAIHAIGVPLSHAAEPDTTPASATSAGSDSSSPGDAPAAAPNPDDQNTPSLDGDEPKFSLRFTPYAWLTSLDGNVKAEGVEFDVDLSFGDVLDTSDTIFGLMGVLDMEVGPLVFQFNGAYSQATQENEFTNTIDTSGSTITATSDAEITSAWLELMGGYRFVDRPFGERHRFTADAFAGVRYTLLDLDLKVSANAPVTLPDGQVLPANTPVGVDRDQEWFEPFVGARTGIKLHDGWVFSVRGDIGGFGVDGSDLAWQVIGAVGYEWKIEGGALGLLAGYRALHQDYSDGGFEWDVLVHGPVLGLSLRLDF